jgi:hypothetical protein
MFREFRNTRCWRTFKVVRTMSARHSLHDWTVTRSFLHQHALQQYKSFDEMSRCSGRSPSHSEYITKHLILLDSSEKGDLPHQAAYHAELRHCHYCTLEDHDDFPLELATFRGSLSVHLGGSHQVVVSRDALCYKNPLCSHNTTQSLHIYLEGHKPRVTRNILTYNLPIYHTFLTILCPHALTLPTFQIPKNAPDLNKYQHRTKVTPVQ